jgi:hypothetical protein
MSVSFGKPNLHQVRIGASYDLKDHKIKGGNSILEVKLNRLLRLNLKTEYNLYGKKWKVYNNPTLTYYLFGAKDRRTLRGTYYQRTKEYWIGLSSLF